MTTLALRATTLVVLLLPAAVGAAAQDGTRSPHGALRIECAACHQPESWTTIASPPVRPLAVRILAPGYPALPARVSRVARLRRDAA
jgi:hypothetical protein